MECFEQQNLFTSGEGGYVRYRIPAIVMSGRGTLLAFCEARKFTGHDSDQIDLFVRRSTDGGKTFGPVCVVATEQDMVCGNPAPVLDRETGTIWLPFCKNLREGDESLICAGKAPRTVWLTCSRDDGASWEQPQEITAAVKPSQWSWYATGPCHGSQLVTGRLIVSCNHIVLQDRCHDDPHHSHVIFSDDHGQSWQVGGIADEGTNESTLLEAADGSLYLNCRNKRALPDGGNYRCVTWSQDRGESWSPVVHDAALPEPICQASVCRFSGQQNGQSKRVVFSNPAAHDGRHHMTVRLSHDECRTWPVARTIHAGPAAYSDLCVTQEGDIYCLYERGTENAYEHISLAHVNLEWLAGGRDQ